MLPKFLDNVFRNFQSVKQRRVVKSEIRQRVKLNLPYLVLLAGSGVIATLGLLIDSSAVVIGAMIIAPLFWPMLGIALGIADADQKLLIKSFLMLASSLVLVVVVSYIAATATPLTELTKEISLRINPTVLDLVIALLSSLIGVLALYYPTISATSIGVALSLSIMPPLATLGIGFAFNSNTILKGAFQLFAANMAAVIFMGVITLFLLNIRPDNKQERNRFIFGLVVSAIFIFIIAIPLTTSLNNMAKNRTAIITIEQHVEDGLLDLNRNIKLLAIDTEFISEKTDILRVDITILVPADVEISKQDLKIIETTIYNSNAQAAVFDWQIISTESW